MPGPLRIIAPLGAGGMGEVYRARNRGLKREVAIKVLHASVTLDADRLRRFEQEALATAALNHPNILAVFDIGTEQGAPYVVLNCWKAKLCANVCAAERLLSAELWSSRN